MWVLEFYVQNKAINHYLRHEKKLNENNVLLYFEVLRYLWNNKKAKKVVYL